MTWHRRQLPGRGRSFGLSNLGLRRPAQFLLFLPEPGKGSSIMDVYFYGPNKSPYTCSGVEREREGSSPIMGLYGPDNGS